MNLKKDFLKGILEENPVLVLVIGLCPILAVSTSLINSLGMGIATTFVLICSNFLISLFKKYIPDEIRIPVFIIIISTFVTITDYIMSAFFPSIHKALGVFIPLIVVNCIILGRAEAFASKKSVLSSTLDGLGMGFGFTFVICILGIIREVLGNGTFLGMNLFSNPALFMILPPGGFISIGILMALNNWWRLKYHRGEILSTKY
jgi:Na+-translocating ferredoxin:NAD+ oxidoreductase subunit E